MTDPNIESFETPEKNAPISDENIFLDQDYVDFMVLYQNSELEKCQILLDNLLLKYPGNTHLLELQKDFIIQLSLKGIAVKQNKVEKKKKTESTFKKMLITIEIVIVVGLIFLGVFLIVFNYLDTEQTQKKQTQLASLAGQAGQLLQSGQPETAAEIIEKIRAIDPNFSELPQLDEEATLQLAMLEKYDQAKEMIAQSDHPAALSILQEIEATLPGLWDVHSLITQEENKIAIDKLYVQANEDYLAEEWDKVIESYEAALVIDPALDDAIMKEQLLNSYLRSIIQMLESNSSTTDDIEKAEIYYRKAMTMIPQSRAYASERENLQRVSSSLLELKFTQTAKDLLLDPNQNSASVMKAVSYLSKASNLNPQNNELKISLDRATLYQIGFQNYLKMEWGAAIENLNKLIDQDREYGEGNAKQMLYEAYYARGAQYYDVGLYIDARSNLENAEILAWEDPDNLLKLFQVQVMLGRTIGKLRDYKNAVSYYQYGLNAIDVYNRLSDFPDLMTTLYDAEGQAAVAQYEKAFNLYTTALDSIDQIYTEETATISYGSNLAFFAEAHQSTVAAILKRNNLSKTTVFNFDQELIIPYLPKE